MEIKKYNLSYHLMCFHCFKTFNNDSEALFGPFKSLIDIFLVLWLESDDTDGATRISAKNYLTGQHLKAWGGFHCFKTSNNDIKAKKGSFLGPF